ncbi:hypothetical protein IWQ62_003986 [Dispira parvispora]|uniref:Endoplasmic reticulum junction formation protein lunapark n=1 Tax=Dispira parvispora TaxID=1520584 RepID=A0A9W8E6K4_9FUNG|nr:hypothetical protein IWQ62_003986 [Dispira parvispora]
MGALLSVFRGSGDTDYQQVLADLDEKIRLSQSQLAEIKVGEKKWSTVFLVYSLFAYAIYSLVFYFYLNHQADPLQLWLYKAIPVGLGPLFIYYTRKCIQLWYCRRQAWAETRIASLKEKQRVKVEELKKKTAYYTTKTLLERYDAPKAPVRTASGVSSAPTKRPPVSSPAAQLRQRMPGPGPLPPASVGRSPIPPFPGARTPAVLDGKDRAGPSGNSPTVNRPVSHSATSTKPVVSKPMGPASMSLSHRPWYDKLVDKIVGEEGPENRYALICRNCFAHNGLVLPQELQTTQYLCPKCGFFNGVKATPNGPQGKKRVARHSLGGPLLRQQMAELSSEEALSDKDDPKERRRRLREEAYRRRQTMPIRSLGSKQGESPSDSSAEESASAQGHHAESTDDGSLLSPDGNKHTALPSDAADQRTDEEDVPSAARGISLGANITMRRGRNVSSSVAGMPPPGSPTSPVESKPSTEDLEHPRVPSSPEVVPAESSRPISDAADTDSERQGPTNHSQELPLDNASDAHSLTSSTRSKKSTPRKRRGRKQTR